MTRERTPEDVERMLGSFAAVELRAGAATRIASVAARGRARRRLASWGGGAAAAVLLIALSAWSGRNPPVTPPAHAPTAAATASVQDLGALKVELSEIREMCEVIPPEKAAERLQIDAKLKECLQRLEDIESRLGAGRESSSGPLPERAVVYV